MTIRVVTDSSCDLPPSSLLAADVVAVPLRVRIGEETYRDGRELLPTELYRRMRSDGPRPRTRPPDAEDFAEVYAAALAEADEVVSIHLSSKLSETMTHALEGAKRAGVRDRVHVVDGRAAGPALAEQVLAAARAAAAGRGAHEVVAAAERIRDASRVVLAPAGLAWLRGGGRIGWMRGVVSGVLSVEPLLTMREGEIVPLASARVTRKVAAIVRELEPRDDPQPVRVAIGVASDDLSDAGALVQALETSRLDVREGRIQRLGPALATHLGPGALVIVAYPESALIAAPGA
ncbi:MAG: DegV family protein [Trueperaceae bacterium]|nr:DegV family protein [Trueperaceae bacterium]